MRKLIEAQADIRRVIGGVGVEPYPWGMANAAESEVGQMAPPPASQEPAHAARVLLIEDEPGIVDFVRRGLEAEGFAVEAALDGTEGERLALNGSFDAIVLDLMLPGL